MASPILFIPQWLYACSLSANPLSKYDNGLLHSLINILWDKTDKHGICCHNINFI